MEIITGVERRRRWRADDKLRIVAETEQPGASFAAVARRQVTGNLESQRRQYDLAEAAQNAGSLTVTVIDNDLGRSDSGSVHRPGFERLVAMLCSGNVGSVYCIEALRLARNGRDWHYLIDLCALAGALVIDPDGTYDPRLVNDRLLLGLKGTMSEYELSLL